MESYTDNARMIHLSRKHEHMLLHESGIEPGIAAERGYYTARSRSQVPETFAGYQRRLGLVVPMFSPDGITRVWQLRPDKPRHKGPKYETPPGVSPVVDVHPRMLEEARHGNGPLLITEGAKSGDAVTSRGMCTVVLAGVWMWCVPEVKPYRLKPCFDHIRLEGREVLVAFDSDCMSKASVQEALAALVAALEDRGAAVKVIYLPDAADGSKQGVDDYLAAGHTVAELKMLARKFEPSDFGRIRLSQNEELSVKVDAARCRLWSEDWSRFVGTGERPNSMRGHSCRDLAKVAIDEAAKSGEVAEDGLRFTLAVRRWALLAATSKPTVLKGIAHLEAEGWLRRDYDDKANDAPGSYVLLLGRSSLDQDGKKPGQEGKVTQGLQTYDPGGQGLSAPRLRWSAPTFNREGVHIVRDYIRRLGKRRGAIIDVLEKEGPMDINEVAEALRVSRARNLRRNLPMLEEAGIISVSGNTMSLNPDWLEALKIERKLKGEIKNDQGEDGAEERDRTRYRLQSEAYREWLVLSPKERKALKNQRDRARAEGFIGDLRPASEREEAQPEPPPVSALAATIRDYLDRSPADACQPPGWLGSTLWAFDLYPDKPAPAEVRAAIDELGGESYLRSNLERGRRAA
jgi:DNA-binding Lrp family transcriptional regulator